MNEKSHRNRAAEPDTEGKPAAVQLGFSFTDPVTVEPVLHTRLQDANTVLSLLENWLEAGWLQQLDLRFARFLHLEQPEASGLLLLAAALTSHQLGRGHVCLDLAATLRGPGRVLNLPPELRSQTAESGLITPAELLGGLSLQDWEAAFDPRVVSQGAELTPLVYDGGRLYLYRYWRYEQQVAQGIHDRVQASTRASSLSADRLRAMVDVLFGTAAQTHGTTDWQRLACVLATRGRFTIITGGPGTGKTTTVVRLLALMQASQYQSAPDGSPLRIRLAAPTGKAAARLSESIAAKVDELPFDDLPGGASLAATIPVQVATLHRLLGGRPHVQTRRHHAGNPLPLDVLVIDEASMVSLSDMAHVMAALPPHAQLILIGDKDQLSSVEAGSVLGELCQRAEGGHYLPATAQWLEHAAGTVVPAQVVNPRGTALDQAVAMLRVSHRFDESSGIGKLAQAVNAGREADVEALLAAPPADLLNVQVNSTHDPAFVQLVIGGAPKEHQTAGGQSRQGYGHYLAQLAGEPESDDPQAFDEWAVAVLQAHRASQVLCVVRNGPWGVEGLNAAISRMLHQRGLIAAQAGWYAGRPIMVTRNNPALRLTNGDIGIVLPYPAGKPGSRALRVAFLDGDGGQVRWFPPNRLDHVETVYALTVHKSQGSEFQHAVLVLPPAPTPVLTRELVYTGITRASRWFSLVNPGNPRLLRNAMRQRVYRSGGLSDVLNTLR